MGYDRRLELSDVLHKICKNVYFQPPSSVQLEYPCIVYKKAIKEKQYADNAMFKMHQTYTITYITRDPDDETDDIILNLPYCSMTGDPFVVENLYHTNYRLYF